MSSFSYITSLQAEQALALRLNDVNNTRWAKTELNLMLAEALRSWNALTATWVADWTTTYVQPNPATLPVWNSTGNNFNSLVGTNSSSPRYQTLTDAYLYTVAQYMLLEPPTGNATWTGTNQFSLADFTQALQRRRDQILQATDCNVGPFSTTLELNPGTNRVLLPDTVLDMRRVRYVPVQGSPATLFRSDGLAFEYFTNGFEQTTGQPLEWDVLASPQLAVTFDAMANQPNSLDCLAILAGPSIVPPTASPLLIPDDWSWVLKWGMMADMLSKETESIDPQRAAYCFPPGTQITMSDMSLKAIEQIVVGDEVITHLGRSGKVSALIPSESDTELVEITSCGFGKVESTQEHPFWVKPLKWGRNRDARLLELDSRWVEAGNIEAGDLVMAPIRPITTEEEKSSELGWLLGIYLAEGSVSFSRPGIPPKNIRFEFHINEQEFAERVIAICKRIDPSTTHSTYKREWANSFTLRVNTKEISTWLFEHGGKGARTKAISSRVYRYGESFVRAMVHGWADGDGNFSSKPLALLRCASASQILSCQMQMLAASVGISSGVCKYERQTNVGWQEIWYVKFAGDAAYAVMEERAQEGRNPQARIFIHDGYLCSYVTSVKKSKYSGPLHNFSVEGDNSYLAGGLAVHNCLQRFEEGLKLMKALPWVLQARIQNIPVDTMSVYEMDDFNYEWQSNPSAQTQVVRGGIDLFAMCPVIPAGTSQSVTLVMVGNMPIPAADGDEIQVSRDVLDAIIDEAQHLAQFKDGFTDLEQSMSLHKNFIRAAVETNSRLEESGIFESTLRPPVSRSEQAEPRFAVMEEK